MKAKPKAKRSSPAGKPTGKPASKLIDQRIRDLAGWRGQTLARMRALILEADPEVIEEWKWMGTPVWSHHGIIFTGESYKAIVKLTFARGAAVADPLASSMQAWKATRAGRSISTKGNRSTRARSRRS